MDILREGCHLYDITFSLNYKNKGKKGCIMQNSFIQDDLDLPPTLNDFTGQPDELISLLQFYQRTYGYLSPEGVRQIAAFLKISETQIYGVASFYSQFRFTKPAKNTMRVCLGTACHVGGGAQVSQELQKVLQAQPGEASPDGRFELQEVACLGCCAQAPVVELNGRIHGKMSPDHVRKMIKEADGL